MALLSVRVELFYRDAGAEPPCRWCSRSGIYTPQANAPAIADFQPYMGKVRKPGTGCISRINDHLFEGRYSPTWIDGKKHARNVYAHTREECEEKLRVLIAEMKAQLAELKRQKGDRH